MAAPNLNLDARQKETLRQKGYRALARAQRESGEKRISKAALAPEVAKLDAEGYNNLQIAWALQRGDRYIREVRKFGTESGDRMIYTVRDPVTKFDHLSPELQAMMEFTADGFKLFFDKYSGRILTDFAHQWIDSWLRTDNLMINVPPGHSKSTIMFVWLPIWLVTRDRDAQILLISAGRDLVLIHMNEIVEHFENNLELIGDFGRYKPDQRGETKWAPLAGELIVAGRHRESKSGQLSIQARGSGQHVLGMRADYVILDDPTNDEIAASPSENKKQMRWLRGQVLHRLDPGGKALVIGQRVHVRDMYGQLEKQTWERGPKRGQPFWKVEKSPAVIRWEDEDPENPEPIVLWPERWNYQELMQIYERIGGWGPFNCIYQQKPLPDGGGLVQEVWKEMCSDRDRGGRQGFQGDDKAAQGLPIVRVVGVDPTPKGKAGVIVGDLLYDRERFVFAVVEVIRLDAGVMRLKSEIDRILFEYHPDYLVFEHSGFTTWLEEDPIWESWRHQVKIIDHHTGSNKNSQEYGVQSLAGDFEFAHIRLPMGDPEGRNMTNLLWDELSAWPDADTTDLVMALWFIKYNYKRLVPIFAYSDTFQGSSTDGAWSWLEKPAPAQGGISQAKVDRFRKMMRESR